MGASGSTVLVTTRKGRRGGRDLDLEAIWREGTAQDTQVLSYDGGENTVNLTSLVDLQRPYCPCVETSAEDPLFLLYTSGSTGQPKGLVHTCGGYAVYAALTTLKTFGLRKGDVFACVADCGWITGHTYTTYGPLLNGGTTLIFGGTPLHPNAGRYWQMVERWGINIFYAAPTAIRSLMRYGKKPFHGVDLTSLRVLGSVGEPIDAESWTWYNDNVGGGRCQVVDTYWQTETGGHVMTPQAHLTPTKPGSCSFPFYGIQPTILEPVTGEPIPTGPGETQGLLAFKAPWPGMARTCLGDHPRYLSTYHPFPDYYLTGDAVCRDDEGYYFIQGRIDDVLNVAGHRIGTAEVEGALSAHPSVAQAAVVPKPHPIKGEGIACFVTVVEEFQGEEEQLSKDLRAQVRGTVGPFATPEFVLVVDGLPMTRSGKIMRRILRKIVGGEGREALGDITTLLDTGVVDVLIDKVEATL